MFIAPLSNWIFDDEKSMNAVITLCERAVKECKRFDYDLVWEINEQGKDLIIDVSTNRKEYQPDIYVGYRREVLTVEIQTAGFGALDVYKHMDYVEACANANECAVILESTLKEIIDIIW